MKFKPITIYKMFQRNQFSIRSDILAKHKAYKQPLIVNTPLGRVEIAPENIDKRVIWRSEPQPSRYNQPFRFCYFSVEDVPKDQIKLFEDIPVPNAPQRLKELIGTLMILLILTTTCLANGKEYNK